MALKVSQARGDMTDIEKDFEHHDACQCIVALKIAKILTGVK